MAKNEKKTLFNLPFKTHFWTDFGYTRSITRAGEWLITSSLVGNFELVKAWSAGWPLASDIPDYRGHGKHKDALLRGHIH